MINTLKTIFGFQPRQDGQFSRFFRDSSSSEKKKVIKRVIREANNDQRKLVEKASRAR